MNEQNKTVVILGMHRSGTSMIAGILAKLGVNMGSNLLGKGPSNPLGHFEDKEFVSLNNKILKAAGGNWSNPPASENIQGQLCNFKQEIKKITDKLATGLNGWKDPRTCLTINLYINFIINPFFIVIHRSPAQVASSLLKRNGIRIKKGKCLRQIYESQIRAFFQIHPDLPMLDLNYTQARKNPGKTVLTIINFLNISPAQAQINQAVNFILPLTK